MKTFTFDDSQWPIVQIGFPTQPGPDDADELLATLEGVFSRQQPFTAVLTANMRDDVRPKHDKETGKRLTQWVKQNKPRFSQYCRGIVYVVANAPGQYAAVKLFSKVAGPRLYGCPINAEQTIEAGFAWATKQLAEIPQ